VHAHSAWPTPDRHRSRSEAVRRMMPTTIESGAARTPTAATPSSLYGFDLAPLVDLARRRQPLPSRPMDRRLRLPVPASSRPPGQWRVLHSLLRPRRRHGLDRRSARRQRRRTAGNSKLMEPLRGGNDGALVEVKAPTQCRPPPQRTAPNAAFNVFCEVGDEHDIVGKANRSKI
jgi:hypothetical protein